MITVLVIHAGIALVCLLAGGRLGRRALLLGALGPLSAVLLLVRWAFSGGDVVVESVDWLPAVGLDLTFRLDGFSALMVALVGGVGVLVFAYAGPYFGAKAGMGRFAGYLVIFAGSMFGLVTADNVLVLFVFWELTSVMSYLLIGFEDDNAGARSSALQALLVTAAGGLAMLAGLVLLAQAGGSYSVSALLSEPPTGGVVGPALVLVLVGAVAKSAQFPFHFWLPGAMAAPTPVSVYLHSATMVKAGIYVVARLAPVYALLVPWWRPTLAVIGLITMLVGGWRALKQNDLKQLLAQGTVSQLGFMMLLVGMGIPALTFAGMATILAHSLFKGALFMVAGIIDHQAHTRDIRRLSGLRGRMPAAFWVSVVAAASMAGVIPVFGFVSKEAALEGLVSGAEWWVTSGVVLGSMLTAAYGIRFLWGAFATKPVDREASLIGPEVEAPSFAFLGPAALLVVLSILGGLVPALFDGLVGSSATAVDALAGGERLALWHGFGLPLALSALALAGGWLLWRRPLPLLRALTGRVPEGARVYEGLLRGVNGLADRLTSILQNGSLPAYLVVIVGVAVVGPAVLMAMHWRQLPELVLAESPVQVVTATLVIGAAIGAVIAKRRLGAVLFLGAVGYGVAVLFVIQGAPDLALTQLLVETLALALFVLVLTRLPARFEVLATRIRRITRIGVSVAAGLAAMAFSLWMASGRVAPSLAPEFLARSEPEGGGRNVVNVILTDFRALDTLGEITVLALAAMGAIALVRARLTESPDQEAGDPVTDAGETAP